MSGRAAGEVVLAWRLQSLFPLQRPRIADDAPYEAIILGVSGIPHALFQPVVEVMFMRQRERPVRHVNSQPLQSWRSDEHKQSRVCDPILGKIGKALLDEILTRLPNLRLDPDAPSPLIQGFAFRGPDSIPVVFDPS